MTGPLVALQVQARRVARLSRRDLPRVRRRLRRMVLGLRPAAQLRPPHDPAPTGPVARPQVRAGAITGERLRLGLGYEWTQTELIGSTPQHWSRVLAGLHLVLAETAAVQTWPAEATTALLAECRRLGVPMVLWATTDDADVSACAHIAAQAALILDVDAGRLAAWRALSGHDRVCHAPPAVQPRLHNPAWTGRAGTAARRTGVCLVDEGVDTEPVREVVRRLTSAVVHAWPLRDAERTPGGPVHRAHRGTLPVADIGALGRRYRVALAPVPPDGTAAPWTALELAASGTAVVATEAGLDPLLGSAALGDADPVATRRTVTALESQQEWRDRIALEQARVVLSQHTLGARVDAVVQALGLDLPARPQPSVSAIVPTKRVEQIDRILDNLVRQVHRPLEAVIVMHGYQVDHADLLSRARARGLADPVLVAADPALTLGACMNLGIDAASGRYVAKMDDDEYYGPHYLSDLVRAFSYTDAVVVGKRAHFVNLTASGTTLLRFPEGEHAYTRLVSGATMMMDADYARSLRFSDLPRGIDTDFQRRAQALGGRIYSADRFNFVSFRHGGDHGHTFRVTDLEMMIGSARVLFYGDPVEHATV